MAGPMANGNLLLTWTKNEANLLIGTGTVSSASDAMTAEWNATAQTWSTPQLLVSDLTYELSQTLTLESGETVEMENIPTFGRVDLVVVKRTLVKDLSLSAAGFTIDGDNYLPGDLLTLSATLENVGDISVQSPSVAFYEGDSGGTLLTNLSVFGWLEGHTNAILIAQWVVPEPAIERTLYAVLDPAGSVTEFSETNSSSNKRTQFGREWPTSCASDLLLNIVYCAMNSAHFPP